MCDDVADVLVVYVASHIGGESSPQVGHLESQKHKLRTPGHNHNRKRKSIYTVYMDNIYMDIYG